MYLNLELYRPVARNIVFQRVDLLELPLPYEDDTFDFIFIRCMMDVVPDEAWDDILRELVRIMKKGAYIECMETYPDLFDAGPNMSIIMQRKSNDKKCFAAVILSRLFFFYTQSSMPMRHKRRRPKRNPYCQRRTHSRTVWQL